METSLCDRIDWVGFVDWNVRDFHGYRTERGSTYNSYLVQDEKTALIDTVKAPFASVLLANISSHTNLDKVDYVVCNHAELDHSGSLPAVMKACVNAELVCDAKCRDALAAHFDTDSWRFRIVADGDAISLGERSLTFVETPMVHWPESMFTYVPEEKLLFSMDAFGQHYASANRFDDQEPLDVVMGEARTYYANIVMLYGKPISRVLDKADGLDLEMIAPSHGVIWRKNLDKIVAAYLQWVTCKPKAKVLVVFDTMWDSTRKMAEAIMQGALTRHVQARMIDVRSNHITLVAAEMLDSAAIAFGSPTLNKTLMPQMSAVLTYVKGLSPKGRSGFAFGSYGWTKGGAGDVNKYLEDMKFDILRDPLQCRYVPTEEALEECREAGKLLADSAIKLAGDAER